MVLVMNEKERVTGCSFYSSPADYLGFVISCMSADTDMKRK